MSSWFAKVFDKKKEDEAVPSGEAYVPSSAVAVAEAPEPARAPKQRTVVNAPVLQSLVPAGGGEGIRIKAQIDPSGEKITLMVDRPLLKGHSCWCGNRAEAEARSPLALALFNIGGLATAQLLETNVMVTRDGTGSERGEDFAKRLGAALRVHIESGAPVVAEEFLAGMPNEDAIREGLQRVIDDEINPGIAAHSGNLTLTRVSGNTAYITMGGGCQGCAASSITLRQGVEQSFRAAVPHLGALLDETDHTAGANPFFTELPIGMGG